jgi:hypothetical protein
MSTPIPRVPGGTTKQFLVVYSTTPSVPLFTLHTGSGDGTLVYSATGTASSTAAHAFYTFPASAALYVSTWTASFTAGPVILRDYVQVVRMIPG